MASESTYHPIQNSIQLAEDLGSKLYGMVTPPIVDRFVRDSKLIATGRNTVVSVKKSIDPFINSIDSYSSGWLQWAEAKYKVIFYDNLMNLFSFFKNFYSSENNDYARICLRFLTLAIPDATYMDSIYPEKFYESFKYDPQYNKESFQKILQQFYKHAKEHWLVNKNSKPLEIVRNALFVVANTMEDILVLPSKRIPFYSQKMADYFINDSPSLTLFSRKHFREFYRQLIQEEELDQVQRQLADQFLQIATVLFELTRMSNKDLIDWTLHSYKFAKNQIVKVREQLQTGYSFAWKLVEENAPIEGIKSAMNSVVVQSKNIYNVGKDGVVTVWHRVLDSHPIQYSLSLAYELDRALRNNGKNLIKIFKENEKAFLAFVKEHRAEIKVFLKTQAKALENYSVKTKEAVVEFLEMQEDIAIELTECGKEVVEALIEITVDFALFYKDRLKGFFQANLSLIREESRLLCTLVFTKLRVQEIAAFVFDTIKSVEEYLCIKESLSKLDLLTTRFVSEVEKKHILPQSNTSEQNVN
jgi:hypothetical protein